MVTLQYQNTTKRYSKDKQRKMGKVLNKNDMELANNCFYINILLYIYISLILLSI